MTPDALPTAAIREFDRHAIEDLGFPGVVLMENAGRSLAEEVLSLLDPVAGAPVVLLCGTGNNGGDGYVAARHLQIHGARPTVFAVGLPRPGGDAAVNAHLYRQVDGEFEEIDPARLAPLVAALQKAPVTVDALLGTGLSGSLRPPYPALIEAVNAHARLVVAADTPSGLHSDTGEALGAAVRAARTVTFAAAKQGFFRGDGPAHVGRLTVAHIGVPPPEAARSDQ
jgi:NAD(P)H-hydrate epimerase